jgi:hypothetical protein
LNKKHEVKNDCNKNEGVEMKKLILNYLAGLNAIYTSPKYPRLKGSDNERIMSDVMRVGRDFRRVLSKEDGKAIAR